MVQGPSRSYVVLGCGRSTEKDEVGGDKEGQYSAGGGLIRQGKRCRADFQEAGANGHAVRLSKR